MVTARCCWVPMLVPVLTAVAALVYPPPPLGRAPTLTLHALLFLVLQGVYGSAEPGQVHAVIGPSGCGKTVLLELLAMRLGSSTKQQAAPASKGPHSNMPVAKTDSNGAAASCVLGQVLVNGRPLSRQQLQAVSAFMPETEVSGGI
eukprot:GHUV01021728.1.p1 GENE.GHUV01021728.1~~GHUV01021728.1.p1  ORF type:complete len:146 (+),score=33.08 GHUV01021728.1:311-748(+)